MTLAPLHAVLAGWAVMAAAMTVLWFVQQARRDASIVDVGWTLGLGVLAVFYASVVPGNASRQALVATLALVWSARLGFHLLHDRVIGKEEDGRYKKLRREWGAGAPARFFGFFQMQALACSLFSLPFLFAMLNPAPPLSAWDVAGLAVWAAAVIGEGVADGQLARFRTDPANRGRTCRAGLWGWSRHPNYFFEWLHWWAYVPLAAGSPLAWVNVAFPLLMLHFLFNVTGIPATEARALETRGDDYRDYQRTVSAFVPLPPRRRA